MNGSVQDLLWLLAAEYSVHAEFVLGAPENLDCTERLEDGFGPAAGDGCRILHLD